jgi:hypothetical protein
MVAQVDEDQIAEVAAPRHPTGQEYALAGVLGSKFTAVVRPYVVAKEIEFQRSLPPRLKAELTSPVARRQEPEVRT